ncbi:hypothetical protein BRD11_00590 [Halobacteriales archaeon SW_12_69_24]|nr:MAG: hypothetical protein BRD11_00590 [Halobacteriales archaeon SW_12_69_24]
MNRTAIMIVLVVGLALAATAAVGGAAGASMQSSASDNASFGAEVSSFMQASGQETAGEVDREMFAAGWNRTDDPAERRQPVERREATLAEREKRLQARQRALDNSTGVARYAIATQIAVGAAELAESANDTERAAEASGLNTTVLAEIRTNASEMHGRAVAELAVGLAGPANDVGPPTDVIGGNGSEDRGNGSEDSGSEDRGNGSEDSGSEESENGSADQGGEDRGNGLRGPRERLSGSGRRGPRERLRGLRLRGARERLRGPWRRGPWERLRGPWRRGPRERLRGRCRRGKTGARRIATATARRLRTLPTLPTPTRTDTAGRPFLNIRIDTTPQYPGERACIRTCDSNDHVRQYDEAAPRGCQP